MVRIGDLVRLSRRARQIGRYLPRRLDDTAIVVHHYYGFFTVVWQSDCHKQVNIDTCDVEKLHV